MIAVSCPHCGVRLNAKDELAGKTRKCPKCRKPMVIPAAPTDSPGLELEDEPASPVPIVQYRPDEVISASETLLPRLDRRNRYVICDKTSVVALWQNDGRGWMIRMASGFSPARRNREVLPTHGQFVLVELVMKTTDQGLRLEAIQSYQLASRLAMTKLDLGDDDITTAITAWAGLGRSQKNAVRQILGEFFMREVWGDSRDVLDYLASADYHSHSSRQERP